MAKASRDKRTKGAQVSGNPQKRNMVAGPDEPIAIPDPVLPAGITIRHAEPKDVAALEPIMKEADPDNPDATWHGLPKIIDMAARPGKPGVGVVFVAEDRDEGVVASLLVVPPAHWLLNEPRLKGNEHVINQVIACLDGLAVRTDFRGKGIARALVTHAEQLVAHGVGSSLLYVTHDERITGFYAACGYTLAEKGLAVSTPAGIIVHEPEGQVISWRGLRTGVRTMSVPSDEGPVEVLTGVIPEGEPQLT